MGRRIGYRFSNGKEKTVNYQDGAYTLTSDDNGRLVVIDSASPVDLTVPDNLTVGFWCEIVQKGAGAVTVVGDVTINSATDSFVLIGRYSKVFLDCIGADDFILSGVGAGDSLPVITTASLPNPTEGIFYSQTINVTGGDAPKTFTVSDGDLPDGLSLNSASGVISGTPAGAGAANFEITVTDADGDTDSQEYEVTVSAVGNVVLEYDADEESYANNDPVPTLTDQSGNNFDADSDGTSDVVYKTDDGNYFLFASSGGDTQYFTVPDFTAELGSEAQMYVVLKADAGNLKLWRMLGESDQAAAHTEVFSGNLYEPWGTTARKDNKVPVPSLHSGWVLYRVVSRNGHYDMQVNGVSISGFPDMTNTFNKDHDNPFMVGYDLGTTVTWRLKYLVILDDNSTNLTADLMTRFEIE